MNCLINNWSESPSSASCLLSLRLQLSEMSNIPLENLEFAKVGEMQPFTRDTSFFF